VAKPTTLQEKVAAGARGLSGQQPQSVQKLASQQGLIAAPVTAYGTGLIGGTAQQAKMAGTPAQKEAALAQALPTETDLSQAQLFRQPAVESPEDTEKKNKAALATQAMGTFGAKVNNLVETTFTNIVGKKDVQAPAQSQLKLDTAAGKLKSLSSTALETVRDLIVQIATETDPTKRMTLTGNLNTALGLSTIDTALKPEEVPGLIKDLPETVAETATTSLKKTIGDTLTVEDLGLAGTSYDELGSLFNMESNAVKNLSIEEIQNKLATLASQVGAPVQQVEAGLSSGLLSPVEKAALRQSLRSFEETGVAAASMQLRGLVDDIDRSTQVQVGDHSYSVDELLSSPAMTDIVKQVLADPKDTTPFVTNLKKTQPDLYNWIRGQKDALANLVTEAGKAVTSYQDIQAANKKLLQPLATQKELFGKLGLNMDQLQDKQLQLSDLPPSAQYILSQPADKQQVALSSLAQLPPDQIKDLNAGEIAALGLDKQDGLWSQYNIVAGKLADINSIPDNQPQTFLSRAIPGVSLADINAAISEDILAEALGYPGSNASELDVNHDGKFGAEDVPELKKQFGGTIPSLKEVVKAGSVPSIKSFQLKPTDTGGSPLLSGLVSAFRDKVITDAELKEIDSLAFNADDAKALVDKKISGFPEAATINNTLAGILNRKIISEVNNKFSENGISVDGINQIRNSSGNINNLDQANAALSQVDGAINAVKNALSQAPSNASKAVIQQYLDVLQNTRNGIAGKQRNFQAAVDAAAEQANAAAVLEATNKVSAAQSPVERAYQTIEQTGRNIISEVEQTPLAKKARKQLKKWGI